MGKPRHAARVDSTHPGIVSALKGVGARVLVLDVSAAGEPDLLVGYHGQLTLIEAKAKKGRLSPGQITCHAEWARVGIKVAVCRCPADALEAIGYSGSKRGENDKAMLDMALALRASKARRGIPPHIQSRLRSSKVDSV